MQCISLGRCLNHGVTMRDLLQTVVDGLGPHKRLGVLVIEPNELIDRRPQLRHVVEDASPHALTEPPLDEVQPRGTRRRNVQMKSWRSRQPLLDRGVVGRPSWSRITRRACPGDVSRSMTCRNFSNSSWRWRGSQGPLTVPSRTVRAANRQVVRWGLSSCVRGPHRPFFIGTPGCVRSNAWTCGCSSMPTTSVNVSTHRVSFDRLNVSIRCGGTRCAS